MEVQRLFLLRLAVGLVATTIVCFAAVALFLYAAWSHGTEPLPPLLQQVTAGGGYFGVCPEQSRGAPLGFSPDLSARLREQFPPGSIADALESVLLEHGFKHHAANCSDPLIYVAFFDRRGKTQAPIHAKVIWKSDDTGKIVWTRGVVFYDGW